MRIYLTLKTETIPLHQSQIVCRPAALSALTSDPSSSSTCAERLCHEQLTANRISDPRNRVSAHPRHRPRPQCRHSAKSRRFVQEHILDPYFVVSAYTDSRNESQAAVTRGGCDTRSEHHDIGISEFDCDSPAISKSQYLALPAV
jgi:hypothetical protein